jgi:hypothetical protein
LVFNKGEYVEGFTSPLWVLLLGITAWFGFDLAQVSKFLSAAFGVATLIVLFYTGQTYLPAKHKWLAVIPGWFLVTTPAFVYWTWSAMDTALFTLLFFCTFVVFLKQVPLGPGARMSGKEGGETSSDLRRILFWAGTCFFLATFARLGMLAVLPACLVFIYYFNRSKDLSFLKNFLSFLAPLSLLLLYVLWRHSFYEALLPNTYYAKAANIPMPVLVGKGLTYTFNFLKVYGIYLGLGLIGPLLIFSEMSLRIWAFSLAIIVTWMGYVTYVGGDHFSMFRFYTPLLPIFAFLLIFLIKWLVIQPKLSFKRSFVIGVGAILSLSSLNYVIQIYGGGENIRAEVKNAIAWTEVGHWLGQNLPADARIAAVAVGAVPYFSDLPTYDLTGLTNREVATQGQVYIAGKVGHQKYNTDYILARRPDYVISPASGLFAQPVGAGLDKSYNYSLYDFITNERALQLYEYQVAEMANGRFVEFLRLK